MDIQNGSFIWDAEKESENIVKHGIDFRTASGVFFDPKRKLFIDSKHSHAEERLFCIGMVNNKIMTVRFTYRSGSIRIIGAGYWRRGKNYYEN